MDSVKKQARFAGLLYLLACLPAPFALLYVPGKLIVPGDPTATAAHLRASETLLRLGMAGELINAVAFIFVVFALYRLLKDVNKHQAAVMVTLFVVSVPISFFNVLNDVAALLVANGTGYLSAFEQSQLDALAYLFLRLHSHGFLVAQIFWGLWLFPFGLLVIRSGFIPRVLGFLLIIACFGYLAASFTSLLLPRYGHLVSSVAMIAEGLGELSTVLWLLIWGAKAPPVTGNPLLPALPEFQIIIPIVALMKTHLQILAITSCFLFTKAGWAQTPNPSPTPAPRMKAIVYSDFGSPDVLRLEEIEKPVPLDNQLLIRVRGASVNPLDWHYMEGTPYLGRLVEFGLLKPKVTRLGVDYAGTVEAVGKNVTQFKPGDEVYGNRFGAFAEYVVASEKALALKPANLTFEQAASVPVAAVTALQALRDKGHVQPGQKVLINGASGGVGTFAVQIAKSFGAEVTGVCSGRNAEMVRSIGADHVIDYTKEDFTKSDQRYDLIIDNVGNRSLLECHRVLNPRGIEVIIGGGGVNDGRWTGPLVGVLKMLGLKPFVTQEMSMMLAEMNNKDLTILADLIQTGKVKPVIDRTYPFSQLPEALRYLEEGHARGKVVITVGDNNEALSVSPKVAATSASSPPPAFVASVLIGVPLAVLILPIVVAFVLNRRFRQRNPDKRGYRWGYYFSIMSFIHGLGLGAFLESGATAVIVCGLIYAVLAWFFAQRCHWAWIALTILSFNPIAWIINAIYLRKRWAEGSVS